MTYRLALLFYAGLIGMMLFLLLLTLAYMAAAPPVIKIALTLLLAGSSIAYGAGSMLEVFAHGKQ
jgi:hypothetical protein